MDCTQRDISFRLKRLKNQNFYRDRLGSQTSISASMVEPRETDPAMKSSGDCRWNQWGGVATVMVLLEQTTAVVSSGKRWDGVEELR